MPEAIKKAIGVKYDGEITIAVGKSRFEKNWKNKNIRWSNFLAKIENPRRTGETYAEFLKMDKKEQDRRKDVGAFVGGTLKNGRRNAGGIAWRSLLTLDADFADERFWATVQLMLDCACAIYSTHKHSKNKPRYRLCIPLVRAVTPDEYQAIARWVANDIGIDLFDDTTYQPGRLMYWPSAATDGDYTFEVCDSPWLNPDEILERYPDWTDQSFWPESSRVLKERKKLAEKQGDPLAKSGLIGAFCRTYSIEEAIEKFLSDVYEPCAAEGRYTYTQGTSSAGAVVYEDKFLYSHHGTDPIGGKLVNAFDLVRLHKFGELDEDIRRDTREDRLPSYIKMRELASQDDKTKITLGQEYAIEAKDEFEVLDEDESQEKDNRWLSRLDFNRNGMLNQSISNAKILLKYDPCLVGKLALNEFSGRKMAKGRLPWNRLAETRPWTDTDDSGLRYYLEKRRNLSGTIQNIKDAMLLTFEENKYHPVKDYLDSLTWDGQKRLETLLVRYFGVEDNIYTRASIRIFMCGAVARVKQPGCQLDYVLTLVGEQGVRKGTFFRTMARYDDWFVELSSIKPKESVEETMGKWIVLMDEMAPSKKSDMDEMKTFITNRIRTVRLAYGHNPTDIPRQYALVATTNNADFLKDPTGDRRWLPNDVDTSQIKMSVEKDLKEEIDQLWAEAVMIYEELKNKALQLSKEEEILAKQAQDNHRVVDDEEGTILEYLDTILPLDWYEKDIYERREFFASQTVVNSTSGFLRDRVCVKEICAECFGIIGKIDQKDSIRINRIMQGLKTWKRQKTPMRIKGYGMQRGFYRG